MTVPLKYAPSQYRLHDPRLGIGYGRPYQAVAGLEASVTERFARTFKRQRQPEAGHPSAVADLVRNSPSIARRTRHCALLLRFCDSLFFSFLEFAGGAVFSGAQ
ncbi:hypothetical protein [Paraburkholderia nodosa]|uniref:hypothetical protein n=1 Tax=Paraburkholderia nodosa TaxID=392320 RepID=UPI0012B6AA41|nr:hypothetical protein [Paraburkholderia nodosa]